MKQKEYIEKHIATDLIGCGSTNGDQEIYVREFDFIK